MDITKEEWLKARFDYITATEIATLLGVDKYSTINKLIEKKKKRETLEIADRSYLTAGLAFEDSVIKYGAEKLKKEIKDTQVFYRDDIRRISATLDALCTDDTVIEVKCTGISKYTREDWPPLSYMAQVQMQMMFLTTDIGYLVCHYFANWPENNSYLKAVKIYEVKKCDKLQTIMLDRVNRFWQTYIVEDKFIRMNSQEKQDAEILLKNTCTLIFSEDIEMPVKSTEKLVISDYDRSIMRQNTINVATEYCLRKDAKTINFSDILKLAKIIEETYLAYLTLAQGHSQDLKGQRIAIQAMGKAWASSGLSTDELKPFLFKALQYINNE